MRILILLIVFLFAQVCPAADVFAKTNLVAWCIVPFDAKKRSPEERAAMLRKLEIPALAYDYRAEHIPTFDREIQALKKENIQLLAWWFPASLNSEARLILDTLARHKIPAQLWVTGGGAFTKTAAEHKVRVAEEAKRIRPIAEAAAKIGSKVGLYNHGGWFGEPDNQIVIIHALAASGITNVGIVYNQHHGHAHVEKFEQLVQRMKPYLLCLNLNGMATNGDKTGKKIMPIGQGDLDEKLIHIIKKSGYTGRIGILNHTDEDAEARLLDNLEGLQFMLNNTQSNRPRLRTWNP